MSLSSVLGFRPAFIQNEGRSILISSFHVSTKYSGCYFDAVRSSFSKSLISKLFELSLQCKDPSFFPTSSTSIFALTTLHPDFLFRGKERRKLLVILNCQNCIIRFVHQTSGNDAIDQIVWQMMDGCSILWKRDAVSPQNSCYGEKIIDKTEPSLYGNGYQIGDKLLELVPPDISQYSPVRNNIPLQCDDAFENDITLLELSSDESETDYQDEHGITIAENRSVNVTSQMSQNLQSENQRQTFANMTSHRDYMSKHNSPVSGNIQNNLDVLESTAANVKQDEPNPLVLRPIGDRNCIPRSSCGSSRIIGNIDATDALCSNLNQLQTSAYNSSSSVGIRRNSKSSDVQNRDNYQNNHGDLYNPLDNSAFNKGASMYGDMNKHHAIVPTDINRGLNQKCCQSDVDIFLSAKSSSLDAALATSTINHRRRRAVAHIERQLNMIRSHSKNARLNSANIEKTAVVKNTRNEEMDSYLSTMVDKTSSSSSRYAKVTSCLNQKKSIFDMQITQRGIRSGMRQLNIQASPDGNVLTHPYDAPGFHVPVSTSLCDESSGNDTDRLGMYGCSIPWKRETETLQRICYGEKIIDKTKPSLYGNGYHKEEDKLLKQVPPDISQYSPVRNNIPLQCDDTFGNDLPLLELSSDESETDYQDEHGITIAENRSVNVTSQMSQNLQSENQRQTFANMTSHRDYMSKYNSPVSGNIQNNLDVLESTAANGEQDEPNQLLLLPIGGRNCIPRSSRGSSRIIENIDVVDVLRSNPSQLQTSAHNNSSSIGIRQNSKSSDVQNRAEYQNNHEDLYNPLDDAASNAIASMHRDKNKHHASAFTAINREQNQKAKSSSTDKSIPRKSLGFSGETAMNPTDNRSQQAIDNAEITLIILSNQLKAVKLNAPKTESAMTKTTKSEVNDPYGASTVCDTSIISKHHDKVSGFLNQTKSKFEMIDSSPRSSPFDMPMSDDHHIGTMDIETSAYARMKTNGSKYNSINVHNPLPRIFVHRRSTPYDFSDCRSTCVKTEGIPLRTKNLDRNDIEHNQELSHKSHQALVPPANIKQTRPNRSTPKIFSAETIGDENKNINGIKISQSTQPSDSLTCKSCDSSAYGNSISSMGRSNKREITQPVNSTTNQISGTFTNIGENDFLAGMSKDNKPEIVHSFTFKVNGIGRPLHDTEENDRMNEEDAITTGGEYLSNGAERTSMTNVHKYESSNEIRNIIHGQTSAETRQTCVLRDTSDQEIENSAVHMNGMWSMFVDLEYDNLPAKITRKGFDDIDAISEGHTDLHQNSQSELETSGTLKIHRKVESADSEIFQHLNGISCEEPESEYSNRSDLVTNEINVEREIVDEWTRSERQRYWILRLKRCHSLLRELMKRLPKDQFGTVHKLTKLLEIELTALNIIEC